MNTEARNRRRRERRLYIRARQSLGALLAEMVELRVRLEKGSGGMLFLDLRTNLQNRVHLIEVLQDHAEERMDQLRSDPERREAWREFYGQLTVLTSALELRMESLLLLHTLLPLSVGPIKEFVGERITRSVAPSIVSTINVIDTNTEDILSSENFPALPA